MVSQPRRKLQALVCTNLQIKLHAKEQQPVREDLMVQVYEQEHTLKCQLK